MLPEFKDVEASHSGHIPDHAMFENTNIKTEQTESPDSGHKEMSSDSLSFNLSQPEANAWYTPMSRLDGGAGDSHNNNAPVSPNNNNIQTAASRLQEKNNNFSPRRSGPAFNIHGKEFNLQLRSRSPAHDANNNPGQNQNKQPAKKIITPLPNLDATGNRLDLNCTPKIDPPPKIKRHSSRSPQTTEAVTPDSGNANCSSQSSTTSENSLSGSDKRISRDSSKLSDGFMSRSNSKELNTITSNSLPRKNALDLKDKNVNNLSHTSSKRPHPDNISPANSNSKLHLSFSDEENTENSEDSGVPLQPRRLDSMTFDEFDALSS